MGIESQKLSPLLYLRTREHVESVLQTGPHVAQPVVSLVSHTEGFQAWWNSPAWIGVYWRKNSSLPSSLAALVGTPSGFVLFPLTLETQLNFPLWKFEKQPRQHFKLSAPSPCSCVCNNHLFVPAKLDADFSVWRVKGLTHFFRFILGGHICHL